MQTVTFPAPAFARLIEHKKATTIEVMDPQPVFEESGGCWYPFTPLSGAVDTAGEFQHSMANSTYKHKHYANEKHFLKGVADDFAPHRKGETVPVCCDSGSILDRAQGTWPATVVSVAAKLVRDLTSEELTTSEYASVRELWPLKWEEQHPNHPFDTTYVWVTEWELTK